MLEQPGDRTDERGGVVPGKAASTDETGGVTIGMINRLMQAGLTPAQVARALNRSPQRIGMVRSAHRAQAFWTPVEVARVRYPWGRRPDPDGPPLMDNKYGEAVPAKRLRTHQRYYALGREAMSRHSITQLNRFYAMLRNLDCVVAFDPELPPYENMECGGWAYVTRTPFDRRNGKDLLIRVDHNVTAKLDDYFYDQWSFPPGDFISPTHT